MPQDRSRRRRTRFQQVRPPFGTVAVAVGLIGLGLTGPLAVVGEEAAVAEQAAVIDSEQAAATGPAADRTAARVAAIERDHGVVVKYIYSVEEFLPEPWRATSEAAGLPADKMPIVLDEIEAFLRVVPAAVTRRDLDTIYVVNHLKFNGGLVGALASGRSIYLCCDRPVFDIRCSLYHELSHILQVAHPIDDAAWAKLLPEDFRYLGAEAGLDAFGFDEKLRNDGFILRYSLTNRHEDIAVLSDWLFVRQDHAVELCEAHPAIRRKAAAVLAWYQGIDPGYDLRFYDAVVAGAEPPVISAAGPAETK